MNYELGVFELSTVIYKNDLSIKQKNTNSNLIKITIKDLSCNTCLVNIPNNTIAEYCVKHNIKISNGINKEGTKVGETINMF